MAYEFYGYPANFLEQYRDRIEKVTKADVQRVAAKYLHKEQLAVLVVGNTADFDKPLSSLGPVTNVDIAIPPPPGQ
jgi:zinc protease